MKFSFKPWTVPLAVAALGLLSFGLLIPQLGFYWDDWPFLLIAKQQGIVGFQQFFAFDRPTTYLSYTVLMPLFGTQPLAWQIFGLLLRIGAGTALWWFASVLWPTHKNISVWTALLFVVYPVFRQQPIALVYHQVWMEYVVYLVSLAAMVAAIHSLPTRPRQFWLFILLSLACLVINLLISEYFLGVELVRPVIIWLALGSAGFLAGWRKRLGRTFLLWAPYLAMVLVYVVWRLFIVQMPAEDRNDPVLLYGLLKTPLQSGLQLIQMALQDSLHIFWTNWYDALRPDLFDLSVRFNLLAWFVALLALVFSLVYLLRFARSARVEPEGSFSPYRQAALLGALLVLTGPIPAWLTDRQVIVGAYSDRLALPAMFGASLLFVGLIGMFIRGRARQILLLSLLIALAVGSNLRVANDFRWVRIRQNRFFWQLYWRAPYIQPNTALLSDGEVLSKMGLYSTAYGINLLYPLTQGSTDVNYWFYSLGREFSYRMPEFLGGMPLELKFRQLTFRGASPNSLVLYYQPDDADCLRVLTSQDGQDPAIPTISQQSLPLVNLDLITDQSHAPGPSPQIFGPEPPHDWCYIFEKADLARQYGDWQRVVQFGDQAQADGYSLQNLSSNTPQEWLPFIEGYAHQNRWEEARQITQQVLEKEPRLAPRLCTLWVDLRSTGAKPVEDVLQELSCLP